MLIEQFARPLALRFLALAFGGGAPEFGTVGRSFLLRPLLLRTLPEFVQIDQISHGRPRHTDTVVEERMHSIDERVLAPVIFNRIYGRFAQAGSTFIMNSPLCSRIANVVWRFLEIIFALPR